MFTRCPEIFGKGCIICCILIITVVGVILHHKDLLSDAHSAVKEFQLKVMDEDGLIDRADHVLNLTQTELTRIDQELDTINDILDQVQTFGNYSVAILYEICLALQDEISVKCPAPPVIF